MKRHIACALVFVLLLGMIAASSNPFVQLRPFELDDCAEMACGVIDDTWTSYGMMESQSGGGGSLMIDGVFDCPRSQQFAAPSHLEIAEYAFWQRGNEMCCELICYIYCTIY